MYKLLYYYKVENNNVYIIRQDEYTKYNIYIPIRRTFTDATARGGKVTKYYIRKDLKSDLYNLISYKGIEFHWISGYNMV